GPAQVPHAVPLPMELEGRGGVADEPGHRRDRLRAAHPRAAGRGARSGHELPPEQHPRLADPPRRARLLRARALMRRRGTPGVALALVLAGGGPALACTGRTAPASAPPPAPSSSPPPHS